MVVARRCGSVGSAEWSLVVQELSGLIAMTDDEAKCALFPAPACLARGHRCRLGR